VLRHILNVQISLLTVVPALVAGIHVAAAGNQASVGFPGPALVDGRNKCGHDEWADWAKNPIASLPWWLGRARREFPFSRVAANDTANTLRSSGEDSTRLCPRTDGLHDFGHALLSVLPSVG
jgi:hypothetical protein